MSPTGKSQNLIVCLPKALPRDRWLDAARTASEINPVNHPPLDRGCERHTPTPNSIMCYQIPGTITKTDGPIIGEWASTDRITRLLRRSSRTPSRRRSRPHGIRGQAEGEVPIGDLSRSRAES